MPERGFVIFWIPLLFFLEFSSPSWAWTEFRTKFFFSFLAYLIPVLAKNNVGKVFFNFLIFFLFFSEFYFWNSGLKFFSLFFVLFNPVLAKNNAGKGFLNFLNFLLFFSEFSSPSQVWTEFGTKIFFSPSRPISSRSGWK